MIVDFPPTDGTILERTDRRLVQLCKTPDGYSIDVWVRQVLDVRPTKLGGWYCSPDAGVNLTADGARLLHDTLARLL